MENKFVEQCPVCNGTGSVPLGFYSGQVPTTTFTGGTLWEPCKSCHGSGVIKLLSSEEFEQAKNKLKQFLKELDEIL